MREFEFLEPTSVPEAGRMLATHGEESRVMAGGTALMLAMRQRMLSPSHVVSVARIEALRGIRYHPQEGLRIGALTKHSEVERSPLVQQHVPMLASMAGQVANPQVRNQGTIGGNLCYADPATDPPSCLMALGAQVVLASSRGERLLRMDEFLVDYYTTDIEADEVLLEIRVPALPEDFSGLYTRFLRTPADHRPLVNVALASRRMGVKCHDLRLVVGGSVPVPTRIDRAEALLTGKSVNRELAAEAADIAAADIVALSDTRGSEDYRRNMVRVVTRRAICRLFGLSTEEGSA